MSKLLSKFLQSIILPSALLIVSKVTGLYIAVKLFNLDPFIENKPEQIYSLQIYFTNQTEALLANSVSNLTMLLVFSLLTAFFLTRYRLSVLANNNPKILLKINNLNLTSWINNKNNTFLKVFVWTMFLWIVCIKILVDVISQSSFLWIGGIAFIITLISTWVLIRTFEIEGEIIYSHNNTSKLY